MKLKLRCSMCDEVKETDWDVEELREADPEDVCPLCFVCTPCRSDEDSIEFTVNHLGEHR